MEEIEKAKKEALDKLRSIQTLDDLKENIEEVKDLLEGIILKALEEVEKTLDGTMPMDEIENNPVIAALQDESCIFDPEIDTELERLSEIPGAEEIMDQFLDDMEVRITPHMEKFGEIMMKLMTDLMGGVMGGMAEVMGGMAEAMGGMAGPSEIIEQEEFYEPSSEVKELTFSLPHYLNIRTVEELSESKEGLFSDIDDLFNEKVENINIMFEMKVERGETGDKLKKLMKTRTYYNEEVGKLLDRIEERTGDKENIDSFREEFSEKMKPIEGTIKNLKREFMRVYNR